MSTRRQTVPPLRVPGKKRDVKRQARLAAPWLAVANGRDAPIEELVSKLRACIGPEAGLLDELRSQAEQAAASHDKEVADHGEQAAHHLDQIIHESALFVYGLLAATAELSARLLKHEPITSTAFPPARAGLLLQLSHDHHGGFSVRRLDFSVFETDVLPKLAPGRVRWCERKRCGKLFFAARWGQRACSIKCANVVRQLRYWRKRRNQSRLEKGKQR